MEKTPKLEYKATHMSSQRLLRTIIALPDNYEDQLLHFGHIYLLEMIRIKSTYNQMQVTCQKRSLDVV